jgi:hypothetical protein
MKNLPVLLVFSILSFIACDDNLDIEPQQAISTEVALSSEQGIKTALIGTYELLINRPISTFLNGDEILNSELLIDVDNLIWTGFFAELTQIFNKSIAVNNAPVEFYWINSYRIINQTNSILDAISIVKEDDRPKIEAEARFIRAMVYFDLINLFAKSWGDGNPSMNLGVPIVDTPSEQSLVNPFIPRNTVADVYQFIVDDLLFATANLEDENGVFATSYAAKAVLSRVYLMQEQYDLATDEVDDVIKSGVFFLLPEVADVFNSSRNTIEDIFSLQYTANEGVNVPSFLYSGVIEGGGGFIGIRDEHIAKYSDEDKRNTLFYIDQQNAIRRTAKWKPIISNDGNVSLIRLAEMYLTRSECRFRNGDVDGAVSDLNVIRVRAGLPELGASEINLEVILKERFLELVFEGHQFRDVKRNRQPVGDLPFDDPSLIYPIPQREMDVNPALVQNEGY